MGDRPAIHFPNEGADYRAARDALLLAERELRRQVEHVAALRRALPPGGRTKEDYPFATGPADLSADGPQRTLRLSELFAPGRDSLILYGFMLPPGGPACPMCTAFLDSLDGAAPHVAQTANLAVVAKAPLPELRAFARSRGWRHLRLLSSHGTGFNADYLAERDGDQMPMLNVFQRTADGVCHAWGSELLYHPSEPGQDARHVDMAWPLWNLLDLTPGGRGTDWYPDLSYGPPG
ncbi:MAG: DUF899 family protein [Sneathiellaceae bacterium]